MLVSENPIEIPDRGPPLTEPTFLITCKQIRNEALEIYYGANIFQLAGTRDSSRVFKRVDPKRGALLRSVRIVDEVVIWDLIDAINDRTTTVLPDLVEFCTYVIIDGQLRISIQPFTQEIINAATTNGVRKRALLVPIPVAVEDGSRNTSWVTLDHIKDFEAVKKGNKVIFRRKDVIDTK